MPLISLILILVAVGVILYCINQYVPMDGNIRKLLNAVVIIIVVIWLLQVFGLIPELNRIRIH